MKKKRLKKRTKVPIIDVSTKKDRTANDVLLQIATLGIYKGGR